MPNAVISGQKKSSCRYIRERKLKLHLGRGRAIIVTSGER